MNDDAISSTKNLNVNCIMKPIILIILFWGFSIPLLFANGNDTTHVKILFGYNDFTLSDSEKAILKDIVPSDTTIILKKINIYGYADSSETEKGKITLSQKRAEQVKTFLLANGIDTKLIADVEGRGLKKTAFAYEQDNVLDRKSVVVVIEYEAKVIEETIIIQSTKKKKED
jgi:outer membrane protein OmpA-like peptidoglycan-associated protein